MKKYNNNLCEKLASCIEILKTSGKFDNTYSIEYDILNIMQDTVDAIDAGAGSKTKRRRRTKQQIEQDTLKKSRTPELLVLDADDSNNKK